MLRFLLLLSLLSHLILFANETQSAQKIYQKKCAMCHNIEAPESIAESKAMVAPYLRLALRSVYIGVDAIEDPATKTEHKKLTLAFLKDYIFNPHQDKSFCEDIIFERFQTMPSLKGFIREKELDQVLDYIYDNFSPTHDELE